MYDVVCVARVMRREARGAAVREEGGWSSRGNGDTARARIKRPGAGPARVMCVCVLFSLTDVCVWCVCMR